MITLKIQGLSHDKVMTDIKKCTMIKLIYKGVLLWLTVLSFTIYIIGGLATLLEHLHIVTIILWTALNIIMAYVCRKHISFREFYIISGNKLFNNLLK